VRTSLLFITLLLCLLVVPSSIHAQDPGAQQDAEAAREKLLKAADQLDNIQANSESTRMAVDAMKADVTKLQADVAQAQADNTTLKQQVADLQAALEKSEAARVKEQQVLVEEVSKMIAASSKSSSSSPAKKKLTPVPDKTDADVSDSSGASTGHPPADQLTPPADPSPVKNDSAESDPPQPAPVPVKIQKGYYHVVSAGETLTLISAAYREEGVHVTTAEIRKANGLTEKSVLKVGQKLFIPKPGN
jgi:hypothetical protein